MNRNEKLLARQKRWMSLSDEQRAALEAARIDLKSCMSTERCHIKGSLPGDWGWVNSGETTKTKKK